MISKGSYEESCSNRALLSPVSTPRTSFYVLPVSSTTWLDAQHQYAVIAQRARQRTAPHDQMALGLIAKRREIAANIEELQHQLRGAVSQLDRIDATIRIFQPDIDLCEFGARPVPPPHAAFKGEISAIMQQSHLEAA